MSLPTLVKTWQFSVNNLSSTAGTISLDGRNVAFAIKNGMLAFGTNPWTVRYSCNSVTAGTAGDGVDRITTAANIIGAAPGSAHSWIVLRQTGLGVNFEVCFSWESAALQNILIAVSYGAGFTGGTTTARPTATDEAVAFTGGFWPPTSGNNRWHLMQSTDGACTRLVVTQGGAPQSLFIFDVIGNAVTGWTNPICALAVAVPTAVNLFSNTSGQVDIRVAGVNGTATMGCEGNAAGTLASITAGSVANEIDGNWAMLPIGVIGLTGGMRGHNGAFIDLWAGQAANGNSFPTGTTFQFSQLGPLIFPWSGVAVQL